MEKRRRSTEMEERKEEENARGRILETDSVYRRRRRRM